MRKVIFIILGVFIVYSLNGQTNLDFTKEELKEDFQVFQNIFEQANSGLYKYHTKSQIDSVFTINKNKIDDKTTFREFYNLVFDVIDYSGSSHNSLMPTSDIDEALAQQTIFFPIPLKYLDGKLYTNLNYKDIPLGSEIISFNQIDTKKFIEDISKYVSTDGHNKTGKYAFLETDWLPYFIYMAYGDPNSFDIKFKERKGKVKSKMLQPVPYITYYKNHAKRFIPNYEQDKADYSFKPFNDGTALLTVSTFGLGGPKSKTHKKYARFLDSIFSDLKTSEIENLLVDIRNNGGGTDPNDILLYSYLTNRKFKENISASVLSTDSIPQVKYFIKDDFDNIEEDLAELKRDFEIKKNGRYFADPQKDSLWEPKPNAFKGKIILLIDPFVASAGSLFASMIKSDEESTVIGQETLGGYYGHTGHIPVRYQLPNTKLILGFSIVDLKQDVRELPDEKLGDGVKPDFVIEPTIESYLNHQDVILEFAKKMSENK